MFLIYEMLNDFSFLKKETLLMEIMISFMTTIFSHIFGKMFSKIDKIIYMQEQNSLLTNKIHSYDEFY